MRDDSSFFKPPSGPLCPDSAPLTGRLLRSNRREVTSAVTLKACLWHDGDGASLLPEVRALSSFRNTVAETLTDKNLQTHVLKFLSDNGLSSAIRLCSTKQLYCQDYPIENHFCLLARNQEPVVRTTENSSILFRKCPKTHEKAAYQRV